jgi:hypothetical protein
MIANGDFKGDGELARRNGTRLEKSSGNRLRFLVIAAGELVQSRNARCCDKREVALLKAILRERAPLVFWVFSGILFS